MNKASVGTLVASLKGCGDKRTIYKTLVKIRTDCVRDQAGIRLYYVAGGLQPLIKLLHKPYEKIIEVVLSILCNCCSVKECAVQASEMGVVPPLLSILANIPNDIIRCRACRLLGNLAAQPDMVRLMEKNGAGAALNALFDETQSIPVIVMAIRSIRQLWDNKNFHNEILVLGTVRKIMMFLVKHVKNSDAATVEKQEGTDTVPPAETSRSRTKEFFYQAISKMETVRSDVYDHEMMKILKRPAGDEFVLPTNQEHVELVSGTLKLFERITTAAVLMPVVRQMTGDETSLGYRCLAFLCKGASPFRERTLKVLANLATNSASWVLLSGADVVTIASELLQSETLEEPLSSSENRHCLKIVCILAGDAGNRPRIRCSGGLKALLAILKRTECPHELTMILSGLKHFRYDQISIAYLIREGLIASLMRRLSHQMTDMVVDHREPEAPVKALPRTRSNNATLTTTTARMFKRARECSPPSTSNALFQSSSFSAYRSQSDYYDPGSPGSDSCYTSQASPASNRSSISPRSLSPNTIDDETGDFKHDSYSPVCSDFEDDGNSNLEEPEPKKEFDIFTYLYDEVMQDDVKEDEKDNEKDDDLSEKETQSSAKQSNKNTSITHCILLLLKDISVRITQNPELAKPDSLSVLVKACRLVLHPWKLLSQTLTNVARDTKNFVPILRQDFVFDLHKLRFVRINYGHKSCASCKEMISLSDNIMTSLSAVAEAGYGRGELAHLLLTGEKEQQKRVALITMFIIRTPRVLYTLLVEHSALYMAIEIILADSEALSENACLGLTVLARNLGVGGKLNETNDQVKDKTDGLAEVETMDVDVTLAGVVHNKQIVFVVTKGDKCDRVEFDEDVLTTNCEVFDSMMHSDFIESHKREIHLKEMSAAGIEYFLYLLVLKANQNLERIALAKNMESALEAYELTIKYMLPEIQQPVLAIIKRMLDETCALAVFEWSQKNVNEELLDISIAYFLTAEICGRKKTRLFRAADNSSYSTEWNRHILDSIVTKCY